MLQKIKKTFSIPVAKNPRLFGLSVFIIVAAFMQYLNYQRNLIRADAEHDVALHEINSVKERLQTTLRNNLSATKTLAFIVQKYGIPDRFDSVAREIIGSNKYVDALQLTRKGEITHVYPMQGNEIVIGYDILKDSLKNREAYKAIEKRELFFAGPFELKQGGLAVVGRLPIFKNNEFWGFSVVILKLNTLLQAMGIDSREKKPFVYQLSKVNPNTRKEEFFLSNTIQLDKTRTVSATIPDGEWNIYVMHQIKHPLLHRIAFPLLGLGISLIFGLLGWYLARQPYRLNKLVAEKTALLINTQNNYKTTIERVSDAFVSLDKNWCYTYMNKKAGEIFNRNPVDMLGKHIWTEFPEGVGQPFYKAYYEAMEKQEYRYLEEYYPPYDLWFENHIYPSPDGLTIYFKDVTERNKSRQEIEKQINLSQSIMNSLPGIFYLYNKEGKFLKWNRNFETVSGYSGNEISRMHPLDFFDADEKLLLEERISEVFRTGQSDVEAGFLTKDKTKIPYYFNGYLINLDGTDYLIGVGIDISKRKKAEAALRESEEKYRYLFNNNPAIIIIWDIENFAITEVNDLALQLYGYSREEFLKLTVKELRPEEDREAIRSFARTMLTAEEDKVRRTWRHLKKNGELMYMDISSHRIDYKGRKAILSLAKDITEQVIAENELKETYDDIRRLNAHLHTIREEERTSIAREIHDELGQQLTALKMDVSWLCKKVGEEEKAQHERLTDMLKLIDDTVKTVRRISTDLRPGILDDFGLIAALEWQSNEFARRTGIRCTFQSGIRETELEKNIATGVFRIYQEALTNVMRHAKAASVATTVEESEDGHLILRIQDSGAGFDVPTVKNKKTLGLTGMKERAHMLGGTLTIESKPGSGTTIILKIPVTLSVAKA